MSVAASTSRLEAAVDATRTGIARLARELHRDREVQRAMTDSLQRSSEQKVLHLGLQFSEPSVFGPPASIGESVRNALRMIDRRSSDVFS